MKLSYFHLKKWRVSNCALRLVDRNGRSKNKPVIRETFPFSDTQINILIVDTPPPWFTDALTVMLPFCTFIQSECERAQHD